MHFAAIALRGVGQVVDMQMSAARTLLQTQARAAAAFGWPDCSDLFDGADERSRHVFAAGTEQMIETAQRANEAVTELQRQVGRVVETQTASAAEQWQRGIEVLGAQTQEGIAQLCETARQQVEETETVSRALTEATEVTRREAQQAVEALQSSIDEERSARRSKVAA
jgi:hypothetical protein